MTFQFVGFVGLALLLILMLMRMPIFIAMALVGFAGISYLISAKVALNYLAHDLQTTLTSYHFSVIPLFILMGQFVYSAGIGSRLYSVMYKWLGHLRGGLAIATMGACAAFGAICGSVIATTATMGTIALPEMKKYKYDDGLAGGCVAAGGTLGVLIPPSMSFVIFGILANVSIGKCFVSGIIPGILVALLCIVAIYIMTTLKPHLGPTGPAASWSERFHSLGGVWETLCLFALVMGGLFAGLFTPTESGSVGAFGALVLGLAGKTMTREGFIKALFDTIRSSCMVLMILVGAFVFSHFLVITRIPNVAAGWVSGLALPPMGLWLVLALLFVIVGCFMETMPVFVIAIPIFAPLVETLGYDLIWFGVFLTVTLNIGMITPPVGISSYVVKGVAPDIPLETIFKGTWPFTGAMLVATIILVAWPQLSTFLPNMM